MRFIELPFRAFFRAPAPATELCVKSKWLSCIVAPLRVVGSTLREYLRIDRYIGAVVIIFVLLFVPLIPRATDNPQMLATASNDDPWMAMALEATLAKPYGNPSNYFDPKASAHEHIPPHWGHLRYGYDNIVYYGGSVFALATPVYAAARFVGLPPFPTAPIILRSISFLGALLSLIVLYNFASRSGMRLAGLLAAIYLMTDDQFGLFTRVSHPDTLQLLLALLALVIAARHTERGDWPSLAAVGLMCGFVQGAKFGGPWTVPMGLLALGWGIQAAGHQLRDWKVTTKRLTLLGSTALLGYVVSTPYAFMDPYLFKTYASAWFFQGLGAASDGPFGRVNLWTWVEAIYGHIGPLATILVVAALARVAIGAYGRRHDRAITLAAVLSLSQLLWYGGFGRLWIIVGYLLVALGLLAVLAFDTALVVLQRLAQLGLAWLPSGNLVGARVATAMVISLAVLLGAPRVLQSATSTLLLASFKNSTSAAVNDWAIRSGVPGDARILYDDLAYFDPALFPNAILFGSPLHWDAVDEKAPDYIVLSSSIYGAPYYRPVFQNQKLGPDDLEDGTTGAYSIRLYQDLLPYERFGPTELAGIEYVTEIKALKILFNEPAWLPPSQSPLIDWALIPIWQAKYWLQKSSALMPALIAPGRPIEGPTFRIFRVTVLEDGRRPRFACAEAVTACTDFKQKLTHGEELVATMDACSETIGSIQCGRDYTIRYWKEDNLWCHTLTGPQAGIDVTLTVARDCVGNPRENVISIFGALFSFNRRGEIYYSGSGRPVLVGHLIEVSENGRQPHVDSWCTDLPTECTDFKQRLTRGEEVIVTMDACQEHIGSILCGRDYTVRYWREGNTWCDTVTGPQGATLLPLRFTVDYLKVLASAVMGRPLPERTFTVARDCLGNPHENVISIFGALFSFNAKREVYYLNSAKPLVGHLKMPLANSLNQGPNR